MTLSRRKAIKAAALTVGSLVMGSNRKEETIDRTKTKPAAAPHSPNILLVMVDQERRPKHTRSLKTPSRDRLKSSAIDFTNAHCTYPLCSPSRATILTGRYPHEAGILLNCDDASGNSDLSPSIPTLGAVLSNAGYRTGYFGKWHLSGLTPSRRMPERYGFDEALLSNQIGGLEVFPSAF